MDHYNISALICAIAIIAVIQIMLGQTTRRIIEFNVCFAAGWLLAEFIIKPALF